MTSKLEFACGLGVILLVGCPQLLEDDFASRDLDSGSVQAEPDAGVGLNVGGSGTGGGSSAGAGGAAGAGGSDVGGSGAGVAGAGTPDAGGPAPVVVSVVPADGARGVLPDAELVFTFSAAMDTSSVEAAYVSSELPAAQVTFTWSDGDTVLLAKPEKLGGAS